MELVQAEGAEGSGPICGGYGRTEDITGGAPITITDATGKVVGLGTLSTGRPGATEGRCDFPFKIAGVAESDFYGIQVGRREVTRFPRSEVVQPVRLLIGP